MDKIKFSKSVLYAIIIVTAIAFSFFAGCSKTDESGVIEIRERMFLTQVNDIYLNANDFLGKKVKLEGFIEEYKSDRTYYYVVRKSPGGCCGNDGRIGFEVRWPEGRRNPFPKNDTWVEATGVLKPFTANSNQYIFLELDALKVLNTRGQEFVTR